MPDMIETIKRAAIDAVNSENPVTVCYGEVISASPLKIRVDQKITLDSNQLVLTRNVTNYTVDMTVNTSTESALAINTGHTHSFNGATQNGGTDAHTHAYTGTTQTGGAQNLEHSHAFTGRKTYTVCNGLKNGDSVLLLRVQGGQQYVVIDKVVN